MRNSLTILLLLLSLSAVSQNNFSPETKFGRKDGINLSKVLFDSQISQELFQGYHSGLSFKHISQKSLGIQIDLCYNQIGWTENLDSTNQYTRKLNYLELPFMTHVILGKGKGRFILNFGPFLQYLLKERELRDLIDEFEPPLYYGTKIENLFDYGLCFGLGIESRTKVGTIQLETRINQSLMDIYKTPNDVGLKGSMNQFLEFSVIYYGWEKDIRKK